VRLAPRGVVSFLAGGLSASKKEGRTAPTVKRKGNPKALTTNIPKTGPNAAARFHERAK